MAKMTILGLQKWLEAENDDLFKHLYVPDSLDRETLIDNIILKASDFEVIYPDADFMQAAIKVWSKKWKQTIDKWVKGINMEYSPIDNYDRYEDTTEEITGKELAKAHDTSNSSGSGNNEGFVSAYDSSSYQPKNKNSSTSSGNNTSDATTEADKTGKTIRTTHIHGNIGVTTSSQLQKDFLDMATWNIYEEIANIFIIEFCIPIY